MITVAVSGGFDPLHVGHLEMFERARALGDRLIVIVNQDHFLMRKKGYALMPLADRLRIVAALRCVDGAVAAVDSDDSVSETVRMLRPDIFANGGDVFSCREAAACVEIGATMVFGLGAKVRSSTEVVCAAISGSASSAVGRTTRSM